MGQPQLQMRRSYWPLSQEPFQMGKIAQLWSPHGSATHSLDRRSPDTTSASTTKTPCSKSEQSNTCETPAQMTSVLPIALGVTVPIVALIVFFFLHRRYNRRLRAEDRHDAEKYKSMDFGMDLNPNWGKKGSKKGDPEMAKAYRPREMKGLSMDPGQSPFFLNNDSRGKDSDSRSIFEDEDRYKLVTVMNSRSNSRAGTPLSQRPPLNRIGTDSSLNSTRQDSRFDSNAKLMMNAQSPSMSAPPRGDSMRVREESVSPPRNNQNPEISMQYNTYEKPLPLPQPEPVKFKDSGLMVPRSTSERDSYFDKNAAAMRNSNNYLNAFFTEQPKSEQASKYESYPTVNSTESTVVDTRNNSLKTTDSSMRDSHLPPMLPPLPIHFNDPSADPFANSYNESIADDVPREFANPPTHASVAKQVPEFDDDEALEYPPKHISFQGSLHFTPSFVSDKSNLTDILRTPRDSDSNLPPVPALPAFPRRGESLATTTPLVVEPEDDYLDIEEAYMTNEERHTDDDNRLSVLMRPLPPDDPQENPEERANRIRSFYKEYFDDSNPKPFTSNVPLPPQQPQPSQNDYYEDYSSEYMNSGTLYDAEQNGFVVATAPFAEPVTRRAMTPPPRAPPRFLPQGPPGGPRGRMRAASNANSNGPHMSNSPHMSNGSHIFPPRGASAMSNQHPPRGQSAMSHRNRHQQFKKPLPPPKTLASLPTPHMLKDDAAIFGAADFAPPVSFRERQNGRRPDSPLGVQRPYSPAVRSFVPLNSSFDDLASVPSPHLLRNSGTFNSLDFAPPPRFKNTDAGSDASSIRSGRSGHSGISVGQQHAMRAGAYRMSRVPKELAGTKGDLMTSLKPQWDMTRPA